MRDKLTLDQIIGDHSRNEETRMGLSELLSADYKEEYPEKYYEILQQADDLLGDKTAEEMEVLVKKSKVHISILYRLAEKYVEETSFVPRKLNQVLDLLNKTF